MYKNRKARRTLAAFLRHHPSQPAHCITWHQRVLREMKQSPRVIALVLSGQADRWLKS